MIIFVPFSLLPTPYSLLPVPCSLFPVPFGIAVEVKLKTYFCYQIRCCLLPITLSLTIL
ncbi:MAG: hypothetical protein F6K56_03850 [Moorea sp. SIO3G5]|nr:hypothetical protein [Moorena sp. SIO3G5]